MEFRNLTQFHAMAYDAIDVLDRKFRVVATKVGYRLRRNACVTDNLVEAVLLPDTE